jgi:hypothetical protein
MAPGIVGRINEAKKSLQAATDRVAMIVASCNTDMETGRLLIPSRFAKEYPEQLRKRDDSKALINELQQHAKAVAREVQRRVDNAELRGFADRPALAILGPIPQAWVELEGEISDAALDAKLAELEGPLGAELRKPQDLGQEVAAKSARGTRIYHAPEPKLGEEAVEERPAEPRMNFVAEDEEAGEAVQDDLVDFGFEPPKSDR